MIVLDYHPLDLNISKGSESSPNQYHASILENGVIAATHDFKLSRDLKLLQMLRHIEENAVVPEPHLKETTHIEFGKMLYHAVFSGELGEYFNKLFSEAQDNNHGFRISLRFADDVPEIAALPWEYLHNGEDFLVGRRNILLSRLPLEVKKTETQPLNSILRMLVIISSPDDPRVSPLNTEKEQEIILEAVDKLQREQKIKVDFTEDATFENIQDYLNEQEYHIVHFTGHGINVNGKGHLVFETEDRKARLIDNRTLADLFSDLGIRLVMLSSCESAKGSNKETFGDLASMLSKRRIPAVVAMQYSVLDDVAIKFAYTFYKTIASGKSVDFALKEARIMMRNSEKSNGLDFATPVLYLLDCNCVRVEDIKPEPSEFVFEPKIYSELPAMEKGFVARRKELRILEKGFKSDVKRAAIIHGFGGIGKTALATRFAYKMQNYFAGVLGVKCTTTTKPEDILNKFNSFLLMRGRPELNQILNQHVPLDVKTSFLVTILNQIRFLIIIDNFEDCLNDDRNDIENPELKSFIQQILNNTTRNTKFIITARYDFDPLEGRLSSEIEHLSLPELSFPQSNWLMNNYTELADLEIPKKRQIYGVIGGHPWTVGQFAKLASVQGVDSLMLDLKPLKKELIEFTLLDKSFSKLDAEAKKLLLCASIYEETVPVEALSWIMGNEEEASPSILEPLQKLIQWGLISKEQEYDETVYTEHTIVRDFAHEKLEEELDKKKLLIRAARYYENSVSHTRNLWDHLKARDYYFKAENWEGAYKIVESTSEYLIRWGYMELAMNMLNESINTTSGVTRLNFEGTLATIYYHLGDFNTAIKKYSKILWNYGELGDKRQIAVTLHQLGRIYQDQGNNEEAIKMYNQSLDIYKKLGDKSGIAGALHQLGMINHEQGNNEEAVKLYNLALKMDEELGNKNGAALTLHSLGNFHYQQGNYEEAVRIYNQALERFEDSGNKRGISYTLHQLGIINQDQGNYEEAVRLYNLSLEIEEEIRDKNGITSTLHQLGMIHQQQGNYKEAVEMYNQSLKIAKEIGDRRGIASTLHQLGILNQNQGNYKEAVRLYNLSLEIKEEIGDKNGIAGTQHQLGVIYQDQGNYQEATKIYNKSLKMFKELDNKNGIAITMHQLGMIYEGKKEYIFALQAYLKAFSIFKELNSPYSQTTSKLISELRYKLGEDEFKVILEKLREQDGS